MKIRQINSTTPKLRPMNEALVLALQKNIENLVRTLSRFDYEGFNRVPPVDGWTAGQVAEHLLIIEHMALTVLSGKTMTADRDPQVQVNVIKERLVDRVNKLDAFPAIMPSDGAKDPRALIEKLIAARKNLMNLFGIMI